MPKKENIQEMFDGIAPSYDRLNHLMSMNVDRLWRKRALKEIVDGTPQRILDVACGTGDSTIAIAKAAGSGSRVVGVDISEGMMAPLMEKAAHEGVHDRIRLQVADAEALPFPDASFHRVTCAFGVRNFEHKDKGLQEFYRVLVPGGKASCPGWAGKCPAIRRPTATCRPPCMRSRRRRSSCACWWRQGLKRSGINRSLWAFAVCSLEKNNYLCTIVDAYET